MFFSNIFGSRKLLSGTAYPPSIENYSWGLNKYFDSKFQEITLKKREENWRVQRPNSY